MSCIPAVPSRHCDTAIDTSLTRWREIARWGAACLGFTFLPGCGADSVSQKPAPNDSAWETVASAPDPDAGQKFLTAAEMRKACGATEEATFERAGQRFISAFLANSGVKTIEPLAGQPLRRIDLSNNSLSDLSPLAGMPLEQVSLYGTQVLDLSPLAAAPLEVLDLTNTPVQDLSPLAGCLKLKSLYLEGADVADLTPLKALPLEQLYLNQCPVQDLTPLTGKALKELNLCDTGVTNLEPLKDSALGTLWLRGTAVEDLSPLAGTGLISLDLQDSQVSNLSPLSQMRSLQRLNIAGTQVTDLRPLEGLPLQRLIMTPGNITAGLEGIRQMTSLRELDLNFDGVNTPMSPAEFWSRYDRGEFASTTKQD